MTIQGIEYQTATEGIKITFMVPARDGYKHARVVGLDSGAEFDKNADGTYTLTVTRGGGILLSTEWKKLGGENSQAVMVESEPVKLASTGSCVAKKPANVLAAMSDATSMLPAAALALAGAGALVAGRMSCKD